MMMAVGVIYATLTHSARRAARGAGVPVYVDTKLRVGHLGLQSFVLPADARGVTLRRRFIRTSVLSRQAGRGNWPGPEGGGRILPCRRRFGERRGLGRSATTRALFALSSADSRLTIAELDERATGSSGVLQGGARRV